MKISIPKASDRFPDIQKWIGQHGASIRNAYSVNQQALKTMAATNGVIERALWRQAKGNPQLELNTQTMLELLAPKNLLKEARKQVRWDTKQDKQHQQGFEKTRLTLISSQIPKSDPQREQLAAEIESWFKKTLPLMRETQSILDTTRLRLESGADLVPIKPAFFVEEEAFEAFGQENPGRLYVDEEGDYCVLLAANQRLGFSDNQLVIAEQTPELAID